MCIIQLQYTHPLNIFKPVFIVVGVSKNNRHFSGRGFFRSAAAKALLAAALLARESHEVHLVPEKNKPRVSAETHAREVRQAVALVPALLPGARSANRTVQDNRL